MILPSTDLLSGFLPILLQPLISLHLDVNISLSFNTMLPCNRVERRCDLLHLPPELRNRIYEYVACNTKEVIIFAHDFVLTTTSPLAETCHQLREEYGPVYTSLPLSCTSRITVHSRNMDVQEFCLSLGRIPRAAPGVGRMLTFRIHVNRYLAWDQIAKFAATLTHPHVAARTAPPEHCNFAFSIDVLKFDFYHCLHAMLARQHSERLHSLCNKMLLEFAEAGNKAKGACTLEF